MRRAIYAPLFHFHSLSKKLYSFIHCFSPNSIRHLSFKNKSSHHLLNCFIVSLRYTIFLRCSFYSKVSSNSMMLTKIMEFMRSKFSLKHLIFMSISFLAKALELFNFSNVLDFFLRKITHVILKKSWINNIKICEQFPMDKMLSIPLLWR